MNTEPLSGITKSFAGVVYTEAKKFLGCKEDPKTPNRSYCIDKIQEMGGWTPTSEPWCAMFVYAVVERSCKLMKIDNLLPRTKSTTIMKNESPDNGLKVDTKPVKGCLFYFPRTGGGHVGFVIDIKDNKIFTIEGNTSDQVKLGQRTINPSMRFIHIEDMANGKKMIPRYLKYGVPAVLLGGIGAVYYAKKKH